MSKNEKITNALNQTNCRQSTSNLIMPRSSLVGCLFATIIRDTRNLSLSHEQRFNYFPASPLCSISWFFEGESHLLDIDNLSINKPSGKIMPSLTFSGPQSKPIISWNPASIYAMTIGIYPDAWNALIGCNVSKFVNKTVPLKTVVSGEILELCRRVIEFENYNEKIQQFENELEPIWKQVRPTKNVASQWLQDWTKTLALRALTSNTGRSARQVQRRIKSWTGQNRQELETYARNENLFKSVLLAQQNENIDLAQIAAETGFADQSHMGRHVRHITGISPLKLNTLIDNHESFWCYRLLGERF